jgi:hypothetical protein
VRAAVSKLKMKESRQTAPNFSLDNDSCMNNPAGYVLLDVVT